MILGEMRGQLRELVHTVNNLSGKFDGLTREVIALGPLAADIGEIKRRIAELEKTGNQQTGAGAVAKMVLNSPLAYWVVGIAAFIWLTVTGRFKP
jgi:hypothetical protein